VPGGCVEVEIYVPFAGKLQLEATLFDFGADFRASDLRISAKSRTGKKKKFFCSHIGKVQVSKIH